MGNREFSKGERGKFYHNFCLNFDPDAGVLVEGEMRRSCWW